MSPTLENDENVAMNEPAVPFCKKTLKMYPAM